MAEGGEPTVIGADSFFKGELTFQNTAKVNGKFEGKIQGQGELLVSDSASCKADVDAKGVQIDGLVEGNLKANDTVRLNSKGTVRGDITSSKMVMAEGASFYGMCNVGPDAAKNAPAPSQPQGGQPNQGQPKK